MYMYLIVCFLVLLFTATYQPGIIPYRVMRIGSFVFFDLEATGLAGVGERPRITELSLVSVIRDDFINKAHESLPRGQDSLPSLPRVMDKLTLCVQPRKPIDYQASCTTGQR